MNAFLGRLRHENTHIIDFETFIISFKFKPAVYRKQFQKIVLLHLKIVSELRKNLSSFFYHIKFIVFETM